MVLMAIVALAALASLGGVSAQTDPPALGDGDWVVRDTTVIRDWDVIMLRGDLRVTDGGDLTLANTTLLFVNSAAGEHGITVQEGGSLHIVDGATVGSSRPKVAWTFAALEGCSLEVRDSSIEECGMSVFGNPPDWEMVSFFVGTEDAVIEGSSFTGGLAGPYFGPGVLANPVRNCSFENYYGVITHGTGIEDCSFSDQSLYGVVFHGGDQGYIARCSFQSVFSTCVQVGYEYFEPYRLYTAEARVLDCTFSRSTRAIRVLDQSTATIADCSIDSMEREGIVLRNEATVSIYDGHIENTFDAIFSYPLSHVEWTVRDRATVRGGSVRLTGNLTVLEDARLEMMTFRNITLLSRVQAPLSINLHEGAEVRLVGGDVLVPPPTAAPERWTPILLGPDRTDVRGALHLDGVHVFNVSDGFHIRELRAANSTLPLGKAWVETLELRHCTLVPDPMGSPPELTLGVLDGPTECLFVDCQMDGIRRLPGNGPWLIILDARVTSRDFLHGIGEMADGDALELVGGGSGAAELTAQWSARTRVRWQNQAPIRAALVTVTDDQGNVASTTTGIDGMTPSLTLTTEHLDLSLGYTAFLPLSFSANVSGLTGSQEVQEVTRPLLVDIQVIDLAPPLMLVDQGRQVATNESLLRLTGRVVDDHSGVAFLEIALVPSEYIRVPLDPSTGGFEAWVSLRFGYQTVSLRAYDTVGNRRAWTIEAFYSILSPFIFIDEPLEGSWVNHDLTFIVGVTEQGSIVEVQGRVTEADNGTFRIPAYLVEGPNFVRVNVTSIAGNHNTSQVLVYLDTSAPDLTVLHPPTSPYFTRDVRHTIRGLVEEGAQVYINEALVTNVVEGTYSNPVNLDQGANSYVVRAIDLAGNVASIEVVLNLDSQPPPLVVLVDGVDAMGYDDEEPLYTHAPSVVLTILTDEAAVVMVDGETVVPEAGTGAVVHILAEGTQTILVRVEDLAGNALEHPPIHVIVDRTPPTLGLEDGMPAHTDEALLSLRGRTEPNCTLTVNGARISVDSQGNFQRNFLLSEGGNRMVLVSTDRFGQSTTLVYEVEMSPPQPEPWPDPPSRLPAMLAITVVILVVEALVLWLWWRRTDMRRTSGG